MADAINVMIALQTPDGLAFGYVMDASPRHVCFTVNNNLSPGMSFAWRMELKGYSETIMGQLTVTRAHPPRGTSDWPRYDAKIDSIPEEDEHLLAVWMEDQEKGGSSRRVEKDPDRFIKDMFSEGMRGASSAQTKLVIDRMNERKARREQLFKKQQRGVGGDFGLARESTAAPSSSVSAVEVRNRISAALGGFSRRKLDEPATAAPAPTAGAAPSTAGAPEPHTRLHPTTQATVGEAPAPLSRTTTELIAAALQSALQAEDPPVSVPPRARSAAPGPDPEPPVASTADTATDPLPEPVAERPSEVADHATSPDPGIDFDADQHPPLLQLRYPQAGDFGTDYRRHLKSGALFLTGRQLGARGDAVKVRLVTPAGTFECEAQVMAVMAAGTGLMLALTREQRAAMAAAAT